MRHSNLWWEAIIAFLFHTEHLCGKPIIISLKPATTDEGHYLCSINYITHDLHSCVWQTIADLKIKVTLNERNLNLEGWSRGWCSVNERSTATNPVSSETEWPSDQLEGRMVKKFPQMVSFLQVLRLNAIIFLKVPLFGAGFGPCRSQKRRRDHCTIRHGKTLYRCCKSHNSVK